MDSVPRIEDDNWVIDGRNILSPEIMDVVRDYLERGPVIVEHWLYRSGCSPVRMVYDDFGMFEKYVRNSSIPGDAFQVWDFVSLCRDDNSVVNGKYPDLDGRVPEKGVY